jgi:hypothetical protein
MPALDTGRAATMTKQPIFIENLAVQARGLSFRCARFSELPHLCLDHARFSDRLAYSVILPLAKA